MLHSKRALLAAQVSTRWVNLTEPEDQTLLSWGGRWLLNHTRWALLTNSRYNLSPLIPPPTKYGYPTPRGLVWLCGHMAYLTLPANWCGTCGLARLQPSSVVFSDSMLQSVINKHGHQNLHRHARDYTPVQRCVPYSNNEGGRPLIGNGKGLLFTIFPSLGVAYLPQRLNDLMLWKT